MTTVQEALRLVGLLADELQRRQPENRRLNAYYEGRVPLQFLSDQFRRFHADRYAGLSDNWCGVVADAPVERMTVTGIRPAGSDSVDDSLWHAWIRSGMDADSQLVFTDAVVTGRSFLMVWADADGNPTFTAEDSSQCVVAYRPGSRRERVAGLKMWQDGHDTNATLYLPDSVWKFRRVRDTQLGKSEQQRRVDEWLPREIDGEPFPMPNPLGAVPLIEVFNRPRMTGDPLSDIRPIVPLQDTINTLWAQLMTAVDFSSFPQRLVLGAERPVVPVLNDAGEVVGERPVDLDRFAIDRVLFLTGDNIRVDEWSATNLEAFTHIIERAVQHIAAETRTPPHYLLGNVVNVSGDALAAAEAGLVQRTQEKTLFMGQSIREAFRLAALVQGDRARADAIAGGTVLWSDPQARSEAQLADALLKLRQIGMPVEWLMGRYGLSPTEIQRVLAMREREAALDPVTALADMTERTVLDAQPGE